MDFDVCRRRLFTLKGIQLKRMLILRASTKIVCDCIAPWRTPACTHEPSCACAHAQGRNV
jgi:hypothetical protein